MQGALKKDLNLFELYFTLKGRVSRRQYAVFYILPLILITSFTPYFLICAAIRDFLTIIMLGKRARDFNMPLWLPILLLLILIVINKFVAIYPYDLMVLAFLFWLIPSKKDGNQFGEPIKVKIFNKWVL